MRCWVGPVVLHARIVRRASLYRGSLEGQHWALVRGLLCICKFGRRPPQYGCGRLSGARRIASLKHYRSHCFTLHGLSFGAAQRLSICSEKRKSTSNMAEMWPPLSSDTAYRFTYEISIDRITCRERYNRDLPCPCTSKIALHWRCERYRILSRGKRGQSSRTPLLFRVTRGVFGFPSKIWGGLYSFLSIFNFYGSGHL